MAAKRISTRPKGAGRAEVEEELGKMMAHCARLEREVAALRADKARGEMLTPKAPSVAPKRGKGPVSSTAQTVPPNLPSAEAIATLREGIHGLRDVLISAAAQIDAFAKKEFDLFDPKVKPLLLLRTSLLKAAGQNAKVPPPVPRMSVAVIDISDLAEVLESLRPSGAASSEVLIPKSPRLGVLPE
jgi:hypothetical protein